ncbi:MAG TPA: NAD(P)-dependent oxidoreductase [Polyangiaceae bacterium]|jgi:nucleoside-diphosphate-sugar epimerase
MSTGGAAIVGAGGFLGAHLVRGFEARGARAVPLVRVVEERSPAGAQAFDEAVAQPGLLAGVDVVVHVAAVHARGGALSAAEVRTANLELVERAMRATANAGVRRFVLVSSVSVYGFPARLPVTEEHPYAPRTARAATLVEAEMRARRTARELGLDLVIARPTTVYGPGDRHGPIDAMAAMIRAGTYRVVGTGDNVLHHTHVDDVVEGLWLAATHPDAAGDHFLLAGPETTTLARLSELVSRAVGRPLPRRHVPSGLARAVATLVDVAAYRGLAFTSGGPPLVHAKLDGLTLPLCFDGAKARRRLGFVPRVTYEEGVMRTLRGEWPALARAGASP